VICPGGDLDERVADTLRTILVEQFDQGERRFRFDLAQVRAIDSTCFFVFLVFAKMVNRESGEKLLQVSGALDEVHRLFTLTHMDDIYSFVTVPGA
jgi:anti-anti-sigma factor